MKMKLRNLEKAIKNKKDDREKEKKLCKELNHRKKWKKKSCIISITKKNNIEV